MATGWQPQGYTVKSRRAGAVAAWVLVIVGGAAVAAGAFLPWLTASGFGGDSNLTGMQLNQLYTVPMLAEKTGYVVVGLGIAAAVLGLLGLLAPGSRRMVGVLCLLVAVGAGVAVGSAVPGLLDAINRLTQVGYSMTFGYGFIVSAVGVGVAGLAAIWAALSAR